MVVGDAHVFPGFLSPVLTQLYFPKLPTTFLTCFCRGERQKYTRKKVPLNRGWNTQPPGHESETLSTEPPGQGSCMVGSTIIVIVWVRDIFKPYQTKDFSHVSKLKSLTDDTFKGGYLDFSHLTKLKKYMYH